MFNPNDLELGFRMVTSIKKSNKINNQFIWFIILLNKKLYIGNNYKCDTCYSNKNCKDVASYHCKTCIYDMCKTCAE
jgi:hypothetical protein